MKPEIIFSIIAIIFSIISGIWTVIVHRQAKMREKKQATLDAVNILQKEVFDRMSYFTAADVKAATEDKNCNGYKDFSAMLARCEHFAVGIDEKIYDYHTASELCGSFLSPLYKKFIPLVEAKRQVSTDTHIYEHIQKVASKMWQERNK